MRLKNLDQTKWECLRERQERCGGGADCEFLFIHLPASPTPPIFCPPPDNSPPPDDNDFHPSSWCPLDRSVTLLFVHLCVFLFLLKLPRRKRTRARAQTRCFASLRVSLLPAAFHFLSPLVSSLTSVKDDSDGAHTAKRSLCELLD